MCCTRSTRYASRERIEVLGKIDSTTFGPALWAIGAIPDYLRRHPSMRYRLSSYPYNKKTV